MQHGKGYVERFVEHIEYEGKQSYSTFPQQPIQGLQISWKESMKKKNAVSVFKSLMKHRMKM